MVALARDGRGNHRRRIAELQMQRVVEEAHASRARRSLHGHLVRRLMTRRAHRLRRQIVIACLGAGHQPGVALHAIKPELEMQFVRERRSRGYSRRAERSQPNQPW